MLTPLLNKIITPYLDCKMRKKAFFVVVGGGFSGIEIVGTLYDFARDNSDILQGYR